VERLGQDVKPIPRGPLALAWSYNLHPPEGIDEVVIVPARCPHTGADEWHAKGYGVYGDDSVLEGQARTVHLGTYETREAAVAEWPCANARFEAGPRIHHRPSRHIVPSWFDPADAGETWDEDGY
jgi:hypothetical protein